MSNGSTADVCADAVSVGGIVIFQDKHGCHFKIDAFLTVTATDGSECILIVGLAHDFNRVAAVA